jgi:Icc-related predicted phosphoesterase
MKIQYASDLHLEFPDNTWYFINNPIVPKADILVLAGDIVTLDSVTDKAWFFDYLSENFEQVYWVPGNHEYYHYSDINRYAGSFNVLVRNNVRLVNNVTIKHDDVNLIFTTLWSKIRKENIHFIQQRMNDYRLIRDAGEILTPKKTNMLHEVNIAFLRSELERLQDEKTVVVTHHVPTEMEYPKQFKGDSLMEGFVVELSEMIEELKPNVWIYGHSHHSKPKFQIGETLMLNNSLGYVHTEKTKYQNGRIIRL